MTKDEALNIAIDYMNERLEEHDAKFQRHPVAEAERNNILADIKAVKEALAQPENCEYCDGTGDVHSIDGEWRGVCICEAGKALAQPEQDWSMLEAMQGSLLEHMARIKELESQRKPLTDEEFSEIYNRTEWDTVNGWEYERAIEAAHGIKGEA